MMSTDKPVVLVTGGTRGIGASMAEAFHHAGYQVMITGTGSKEQWMGKRAADEAVDYIQADFSVPGSLQALAEYITTLDRLDVLVNNAGINIIKPIAEVSDEDYTTLQNINIRAPYKLCQAAAAVMRKQGGGRIVNVGSIWSVMSKSGRSLYSTSKSGLAGLTRALAVELGEHGILVNCLSPGFVLTDLTRKSLSEEEMEEMARQLPLRRFAMVDEIAQMACFMASPENTYMTGQNVVVDGGFTCV